MFLSIYIDEKKINTKIKSLFSHTIYVLLVLWHKKSTKQSYSLIYIYLHYDDYCLYI